MDFTFQPGPDDGQPGKNLVSLESHPILDRFVICEEDYNGDNSKNHEKGNRGLYLYSQVLSPASIVSRLSHVLGLSAGLHQESR